MYTEIFWTKQGLLKYSPDGLLHLSSTYQSYLSFFHKKVKISRKLELCNTNTIFFVESIIIYKLISTF